MVFTHDTMILLYFYVVGCVYTPVDVNRLRCVIEGCPDADFLIQGFSEGFRLGVKEHYHLSSCKMRLQPASTPLLAKLADEVNKGRILGPFQDKPLPDLFVSPLHVIPKPDSTKVRLIFNLSHPKVGSVNDNIKESSRSVKYCSLQDVGLCLVTEYENPAWLAKVDLKDAYRVVPIHPDDWRFLGMQVDGLYYIDRMLPMGAASSCQLFQRISDGLKSMLLKRCPSVHVFNYLDDFLFVGETKEVCEEALQRFESLCHQLRIPIAEHKTVRPTQELTFLGLGVNSNRRTLHIPQEKQLKMENKLIGFLAIKKPKVKEWQSIAGSLNHLAQVIPAGRIYIRSLYESLVGLLSQQRHIRRRITSEVREDLNVWFALLRAQFEKPFRILTSHDSTWPPLCTDASTSVGFGAVWGRQWFFGTWPQGKKVNIAVLELYPITLALLLLDETVSDTVLNVITDNQALVSVLNHLYTKDATLARLLRPVAEVCLKKNIKIVAQHVAGKLNRGPDLLSRGKLLEFHAEFPLLNPSPVHIPDDLLPENTRLLPFA